MKLQGNLGLIFLLKDFPLFSSVLGHIEIKSNKSGSILLMVIWKVYNINIVLLKKMVLYQGGEVTQKFSSYFFSLG
jgi:hypothetical protein